MLSKTETERVVEEIFDVDKLNATCSKHQYIGNKIPPQTHGCSRCWLAYYIWDMATTPPSLRKERLDELESIIHHAVEYEKKGQFGHDLELFQPGDPRFKVEIEKDAE